MDSVPRLTCKRCKKRKIKCDKLVPCSACQNVNVECEAVQRARRPRGRSGIQKTNNGNVETRITRIESLLKEVTARRASTTGLDPRLKAVDGLYAPKSHRGTDGDFVAPDFWTELSQEVSGLRETFESSDEDALSEPTTGTPDLRYSEKTVLFGLDPKTEDSFVWPPTTKWIRTVLLDLYKQRVDSIFKILHWPTVIGDIELAHMDQEYASQSPSARALEFAIYFMALCSIRDDESVQLGLGDRMEMIEQYRIATELLISEGNILRNPGVTILQAFVIYLIGLRAYQNSAPAWTLLALAVRVATSLQLGHENPAKFSPFDLQVRRRLWYSIALLDIHSSFDRGTFPMLRFADLGPPPLCINDKDMAQDHVPQTPSLGFTDMSFFEVMFKSMLCHQKMLSMPSDTDDQWREKLQLVQNYESSMHESYCLIGTSATPLERLAKFAVLEICPSMHLLLRRPPYRQHREAVPAWDDFDVMEMATTVLERHLGMRAQDFAPWAWKSWVKWHALAVLLAELSGRRPGPHTERNYLIARKSFNGYAHVIADSEWGMLWKPIAKMMRRVHRTRGALATLDLTLSSKPPAQANRSDSMPEFETTSPTISGIVYPDLTATIYEPMENLALYRRIASNNALVEEEDQTVDMWDNPELNWDVFLDDANLNYNTDSSNVIF